MVKLHGKNFTSKKLRERVGDVSQIGGVRLGKLEEGKSAGVKIADFRTGSGFNFSVSISRGMDISSAEYKGIPLCWRSATGNVHPVFFEPEGLNWLRSFFGGLLTTCGLTYFGPPCEDEGESLGLHGRVSHIPAENIGVEETWEGDEYILSLKGKVRETKVFGENLTLKRKIHTQLGEKRLLINDEVVNEGFEPSPHMILYHVNIGYPLVSEDSELISPAVEAIPRDEEAEKEQELYHKFLPPTPSFKERCYFLKMQEDQQGYVTVAIVNRAFRDNEGIGIYLKYRKKELPYFVEWKMMGQGIYVVGIEPANCKLAPRSELRKEGNLPFLQPGEKKEYNLEIGVLSSPEEIRKTEDRSQRTKNEARRTV